MNRISIIFCFLCALIGNACDGTSTRSNTNSGGVASTGGTNADATGFTSGGSGTTGGEGAGGTPNAGGSANSTGGVTGVGGTSTGASTAADSKTIVTLASGQTNLCGGPAVNDTYVFWCANSTLMRVEKAGGTPTTLVTFSNRPGGLSADADSVYWDDYDNSNASVMKVSVTGGTPVALTSGQVFPGALALDESSVYWVNSGSGNSTGSVMKVTKDGNAPVTLASGLVTGGAVAVDATSVYWEEGGYTAPISKVALGGGAPAVLANAQTLEDMCGIALDANNVYWMERWNAGSFGGLYKVAKGGGTVVKVVTGETTPCLAGVDATDAYWTNSSGVRRVSLNGGTPVTAISGPLSGFAMDATRLYWLDGNSVKSVAK